MAREMEPLPRVGASVLAGMWEDLRNKPSSAEWGAKEGSILSESEHTGCTRG